MIKFLIANGLLVVGLLLVLYNVYWLSSREPSMLGAGFAYFFIGIGILLSIIGGLMRR